MATPRQQLTGQIKTDITRAAEKLQVAQRLLAPLLTDPDLATVARASRASLAISEALRLLEYRGAETIPSE